MKASQFDVYQTRVIGRDIYVYNAKSRADEQEVSIVSILHNSALSTALQLQDHADIYSYKSFLQYMDKSFGIYSHEAKQLEVPRLTLFTNPVADFLHEEILRRKLKNIAFCFEEISAVFTCLYGLTNHLYTRAELPSNIPKDVKDWFSALLIMRNFTIQVFPVPGHFAINPLVESLTVLSRVINTRDEFIDFSEKDPLHPHYIDIISLILYLEKCEKLEKTSKLTAADLGLLISRVANADISKVWEGLVQKYVCADLNRDSRSSFSTGKISKSEMKMIIGPNETSEPPMDLDIYDVWRRNSSYGYLTQDSTQGYSAITTNILTKESYAYIQNKEIDRFELSGLNNVSVLLRNLPLWSSLKELALVSCSLSFDDIIALNGAGLDQLEHMDLSNNIIDPNQTANTFSSEGLMKLIDEGNILKNLKSLKLRANKLSTKAVVQLVNSPNINMLVILDLGYNDELTNTAYHAIRTSQELTKLEELVLSGCRLGDLGLYYLLISDEGPFIETIMDYQETLEDLEEITQQFMNKLKRSLVKEEIIHPTVFQLKRLRIDVCSLGRHSLGIVCCSQAFEYLDELDLSFSDLHIIEYEFFDIHQDAKNRIRRIKHLNLQSTSLSSASAKQLFTLIDGGRLERLCLKENEELDLKILSRTYLPKLKALELEFMGKNSQLDLLQHCLTQSHLEDLRLSFTNTEIANKTLKHPKIIAEDSLSKLRVCLLAATGVTEELFIILTNTPILQDCFYLDLSMNNLKKTSLEAFIHKASYINNLKYLNLSGHRFTVLSLRRLCRSTNLKHLQILDLSLCGFNDKTLDVFSHTRLTSLEYLILAENDFTVAGLYKHAKKLPRTLKYLDLFCHKFDNQIDEFASLALAFQRVTKTTWFIPKADSKL